MTNTYYAMRKKQQAEFNSFDLGFAFSQDQLNELMKKWNCKEEDLVHIPLTGYIRKTDLKAFREMDKKHGEEFVNAFNADKTGEGFIKDMMVEELINHECSVDPEWALNDTLSEMPYLRAEEVYSLKVEHAAEKAMIQILKSAGYEGSLTGYRNMVHHYFADQRRKYHLA